MQAARTWSYIKTMSPAVMRPMCQLRCTSYVQLKQYCLIHCGRNIKTTLPLIEIMCSPKALAS